MNGKHCLAAALLCAASLPVSADVLVQMSDDAQRGASLWLKPGVISMEHGGGEQTGMRFDANTLNMRVLQHAERQYYEIDPARVRQLRRNVQGMGQLLGEQQQAQIAQMMAQQMQGMPPEQRAQIEKQMQRFMQPQASQPQGQLEIKFTGQHQQIAGFDCRDVAIYRDGQLAQRACVSEPKKLGLSDAEGETLKRFFQFSREMAEAVGDTEDELAAVMAKSGAAGLPLQVRDADGRLRAQLTSLQRRDAPAGTFDIPRDYQRGVLPF
jgi:hypothetical protein